MKCALVQLNISWENPQQNHDHLLQLLEPIDDHDLIVLPEMWTTGFTMNAKAMAENMDGPTVELMSQIARSKKALVMGSVIIQENNNFYNRMIAAHPNGKLDTYDKRHLFSFAKEDLTYTPGSEHVDIIEHNGWRILPQICYDLRFPVYSRFSEKRSYDLAVYVANFPNKRIDAWNQLLRARAIENQSFVIGVNRYGMDGMDFYYDGATQAIDYSGKILVYLNQAERIGSIELDLNGLQKFRQNFPFLKDRDLT